MPRSRRWRVTVLLLVALGVVLGLEGFRIFNSVARTCSDRERAVLLEFPQYGGAVVEPRSDSESGGCAVSLDTTDTYEEVIVYYKLQLGSHGWTIRNLEEQAPEVGDQPAGGDASAPSAVPSCGPSPAPCAGTLAAIRSGFSFTLAFESTGKQTSVVVRVNKSAGGKAALSGHGAKGNRPTA